MALATKLFTMRESSVLIERLTAQQISLDPTQLHAAKAWLSEPEKTQQLITSLGHPMADQVMAHFQISFVSGFSSVMVALAILVALVYLASFRSIQTVFHQKSTP